MELRRTFLNKLQLFYLICLLNVFTLVYRIWHVIGPTDEHAIFQRNWWETHSCICRLYSKICHYTSQIDFILKKILDLEKNSLKSLYYFPMRQYRYCRMSHGHSRYHMYCQDYTGCKRRQTIIEDHDLLCKLIDKYYFFIILPKNVWKKSRSYAIMWMLACATPLNSRISNRCG